jgi:peptidoglycan/LPS O-acetylase OafA/YrhL
MIQTLQSLRFIFSLTVMLAHFSYAGIEGHSTGVGPMFFMLMTGVVMSRSYGEKVLNGTFRFRDFLLRRLFKFYPLHLLCLLAIVVIRRQTMSGDDYLTVLPNLLLLQSWIPVQDYYFSCNAVSWYLSDLMLFLLLFPWLYRKIGRMSGRALTITTVSLLAVYVVYVSLVRTDDLNYWLYIFPPVRLFDFLWGMILWRCYQLHPSLGRVNRPTIAELLLVTGVVLTIVSYPLHERWHYALIHWVVMVPLMMVFLQGDCYGGVVSRFLKRPGMVWLGGLTLDTYLLHQLLFAVLLNNANKMGLELPYLLMLTLCVSIVVVVSWGVHTYFVTPMNRRLLGFIK